MSEWQDRVKLIEQNRTDAINYSGAVDIPLSEIVPDRIGLRTEVVKDAESYINLRNDIEKRGVIDSISVRRSSDGKFIIINGLHRYTACTDLGMLTMPCIYFPNVTSQTDVMLMQISSNIQRVATKPVQFGKQILAIMAMSNGTMTIAEVASQLNISTAQVSNLLRLNANLAEPIKKIVDAGEITAVNAYALAKLPDELQSDYLDYAKNESAYEFAVRVGEEIRKLKKGAKSEGDDGFKVVPTLRKKPEFIARINSVIADLQEQFEEADILNAGTEELEGERLLGFYLALLWATKIDAESKAAAEDAFHAREQERLAKKAEKDQKQGKSLSDLVIKGGVPKMLTTTAAPAANAAAKEAVPV